MSRAVSPAAPVPFSGGENKDSNQRRNLTLRSLFQGRLRTKFLLSSLLISTALTWTTLLLVRQRVRMQERDEILEALNDSVATFQNFQHERELMLMRMAALLANLPSLKALMTSQDEVTIQDGSIDFWRKVGSDTFVLANPAGRLMALDTAGGRLTRRDVQQLLLHSLQNGENRDWWSANGHLFQIFIQPIYFGSPADETLLGVLGVGYEINDHLAQDVSRIASSKVAFRYGDRVVVSTLSAAEQSSLIGWRELPARGDVGAEDVRLGEERFLATSVDLAPGIAPAVRLTVLKSYDEATAFLERLNRWILGVGLAAVIAGSLLVFLISDTFTRPLSDLVAGVRALEKGDFGYPLQSRGHDEVSDLTGAFRRMRRTLERTQEELLQSERLAVIGRMASSISHDLRHPLTAILAYAEFLSESNLGEQQRKELYEEIRLAVNRMTEQLSSLLGFSKGRESFRRVRGNVVDVVQRAAQGIQARPEFRHVPITISEQGKCDGWFDSGRLERIFQNLLLNACEAVSPQSGKVEVHVQSTTDGVEIRIEDNGSGIPAEVQGRLFQPFVSHGKQSGFGLGLAVVQKITQDHGGQITVERTGPEGTVFLLKLPFAEPVEKTAAPEFTRDDPEASI